MLLEPGERTASVEEVASELHTMVAAPNCTVLLAEAAGNLVGYVEATGGRFRRNRVTAEVVIGVAAAASGRKVGSALITRLVRWAGGAGLTAWNSRSWPTTVGHAASTKGLASSRRDGELSVCRSTARSSMRFSWHDSWPPPLFPQR